MRIAICDDEKLYRHQLLSVVNEYIASHEDIAITVSAFENADELLETVEKYGGYDIYILDVMMPGMDGIELGIELRQNGYDGSIIYLTSSEEYAIESYKAEASNYILKPIVYTDLVKALEKTIDALENKVDKSILVKTKDTTVRLPLSNILYAELHKRTILYHLTNGDTIVSIMIRVPFVEAVQNLLAHKHFVLCGTSTVMNLHHILSVGLEEVVFTGDCKVFFSKKLCRDIRSLWSDFWSKEDARNRS